MSLLLLPRPQNKGCVLLICNLLSRVFCLGLPFYLGIRFIYDFNNGLDRRRQSEHIDIQTRVAISSYHMDLNFVLVASCL